MSNKLWRKKYEFVVDRNGEVFVKLDDGTYDIIWVRKDKPLQDVIVFSENGIKFIEEYCYLDDLIAQADKAERLLAKVDWLEHNKNAWEKVSELKEEHIQRLQKAVDLAVDALEYADKTLTGGTVGWETHAQKAIKEIKQLIKENQ